MEVVCPVRRLEDLQVMYVPGILMSKMRRTQLILIVMIPSMNMTTRPIFSLFCNVLIVLSSGNGNKKTALMLTRVNRGRNMRGRLTEKLARHTHSPINVCIRWAVHTCY